MLDPDVERAVEAALAVLRHNAEGPPEGALLRTAGWGYPEPYTRDLMIAAPGILLSGDADLIAALRRVLAALARNQSPRGQVPGLADDPRDLGSSDTTPLFLIGLALYRAHTGEAAFLDEAAGRALKWLAYQSPDDRVMVAQQPTSDWRDEQWVLGYGLYVNTVLYAALRLLGCHERADALREMMEHFTVKGERQQRHVHEGLVLRYKPYYAMWSYKVYRSERFDLLGNSLAILSGIASHTRASHLVTWIEAECAALRKNELLAVDLPPNFFPYVQPDDPDWMPRYAKYNQPGEYHNGGIWPFICGFYVASLVAAGRYRLAERTLLALAELVRLRRQADVEFGFNEWHRAQDGTPQGQDWQTWSAAMYLYAAHCVQTQTTPFFDRCRQGSET